MTDAYTIPETGFPWIVKDPDAVLDYLFDWSDWLAEGENIASHTVEVESGTCEVESEIEQSGVVTAWISGGALGETSFVRCRITSDNVPARTDDRTVKIKIRRR
jgi:hypothetical protein